LGARLHPDRVAASTSTRPCATSELAGRKGKGVGSPGDWQNLLKVYGLTEAQAMAYKGNPIDDLAPLAKARVPVLSVVGDADTAVPRPRTRPSSSSGTSSWADRSR